MKIAGKIIFLTFVIFKKIEDFFFEKILVLFSSIGLKKISVIASLSKVLIRLREKFFISIYRKVKHKSIILTEIEGNKLYIDADDLGMSREILLEGAWEKYQTKLFKMIVRKGMTVVDIGALFGHYSLIAAKLVGNNGVVYAFEPVPEHYEIFCKNIEVNNYNNIVPIRRAISNKCGKERIWIDRFNIASASLMKENTLPLFNYHLSEKYSVEIGMITLDKFFENETKTKIDLIKMDVGGAEGLIVAGAERTLKCNKLKIFMEFWPEGLRRFGTDPLELLFKLQKYGFKIKLINEHKQALEPLEPIEFCRTMDQRTGHQEFNLLLEK